ncbi:MAG: class I SAM-dependent methyltransferase [Myxococcales bacterium]|nr:class I SAM-dependent methyltransferase [Myxococcales bacterium]
MSDPSSPLRDATTHLREAFGAAQPEHYAWQTGSPYVAERERELCERAFLPLGQRVLDVGCGEGATLYHLGGPEGAVGIDLFEEKIAFAREQLPRCTFLTASAYDLPFDADTFDHVLVRDVIHHLEEPERFLSECARVLAPGGRVDVLEPCRNNPLILFHALTQPAERGELRSTPAYLRRLLSRDFNVKTVQRMQAMPIHRVVFHPRLGWPRAGMNPWVRGAVHAVERLAEHVLPRVAWAYIHVRAKSDECAPSEQREQREQTAQTDHSEQARQTNQSAQPGPSEQR